MANDQTKDQAREQARDQGRDQANKAADVASKAAEASRRTIDEGGKAASRLAEHAARAQEHMAHSAADAGLHGAGIMKSTIEAGIETAVQSFERIADRFTTALGFAGPEADKLAARSRENLDAISQANTAMVKGAEDVSHQWMTLAKDSFARNFDAIVRIGECRSIQDLAAMQSQLWRDNMSHVIEGSRRVVEIYSRSSEEAANRVRSQRAA
jgi:phasin family protein